MKEIENKEKVSEIKMYPTAYTKCKIGQDWYKCNFEVLFIPSVCYPDYIEVHEYIMQKIDGKEKNIEDAAKDLYDMLSKYNPAYLSVTNHITGCKTHFDVDVTIKKER